MGVTCSTSSPSLSYGEWLLFNYIKNDARPKVIFAIKQSWNSSSAVRNEHLDFHDYKDTVPTVFKKHLHIFLTTCICMWGCAHMHAGACRGPKHQIPQELPDVRLGLGLNCWASSLTPLLCMLIAVSRADFKIDKPHTCLIHLEDLSREK